MNMIATGEGTTPSATPAQMNVVANGIAAPTNNPAPVAPTTDWTTGLDDGMKGYVQNKGFKDVPSIVHSYQNLEKLIGVPKERLIKMPEKSDAPEWGEIYDRMGRPKTAADYKLEVADNSDEGFVNWAKENFHKNGLTQKQAETLIKGYNELAKTRETEYTSQVAKQHENELKSLKSEWGAAWDQNSSIVDQAAQQFGIDEKTLIALRDAMGSAGAMKLLHNIGSKIGEASFVGSNSPQGFNNILSPQQANAKIQDYMKDPEFTRRYLSGDVEARETMTKLHKMKLGEL